MTSLFGLTPSPLVTVCHYFAWPPSPLGWWHTFWMAPNAIHKDCGQQNSLQIKIPCRSWDLSVSSEIELAMDDCILFRKWKKMLFLIKIANFLIILSLQRVHCLVVESKNVKPKHTYGGILFLSNRTFWLRITSLFTFEINYNSGA